MAATVDAALAEARALGIDRLDAQLLLGHLLRRPRTWVLGHGETILDAQQSAEWQTLSARRARGEPLAYLVGRKEFHGLMLEVDPRVLVPRPDTEVLVDWALEILQSGRSTESPARVVDLGTGSAAVALAIKAACPPASVFASDQSREALDVARLNAVRLGLEIDLRHGSWWAPWQGHSFRVAVSNPPYLADDDPHLDALAEEPAGALVAGCDGLAALREIVASAADHLEPGGWLLLEHGFEQAPAVTELLVAAGFSSVETRQDLGGRERCSGGRRPER